MFEPSQAVLIDLVVALGGPSLGASSGVLVAASLIASTALAALEAAAMAASL